MYRIIDLADATPELPEQLGNKEKYWFRIYDWRYLFKIWRPGTDENWAEKIAAELAGMLGLPHAEYDFAIWRGHKGVLSPHIAPEDARLILGNKLLASIHASYPRDQIRRVRDHTLGRIHALLTNMQIGLPPCWVPPANSIVTAYDLFVGYLLLDACVRCQLSWPVGVNYLGR